MGVRAVGVADTVYGMRGACAGGWRRGNAPTYWHNLLKERLPRGPQRRVGEVARSLSEESWVRASAVRGQGERLYDWACVELPESGMYREGIRAGRWLLMREHRGARRSPTTVLRTGTDLCAGVDRDRG